MPNKKIKVQPLVKRALAAGKAARANAKVARTRALKRVATPNARAVARANANASFKRTASPSAVKKTKKVK